MLTFERVLNAFEYILQQDPLYEVVSTSHGYTLLGVHSSYLESELLGDERDDLTEQEEEEIEAQCQRLRKACLSE